jgi:tetratricopeptide (TPR) repeat protein
MFLSQLLLLVTSTSEMPPCPLSNSDAAAIINRAEALRREALLERARALLEGARPCVPEGHPVYPVLLNNLAQIYKRTGPEKEVVTLLRAALRAWRGTPNYSHGLANLGDWYQGRRDFGRAENLYREAIELQPGVALHHNNLGLLLHQAKRHEEAERCYRLALRLYDETGIRGAMQTWGNLGLLLYERKRYGEAAAAFQRMAQITPLPVEEKGHAVYLEVYASLLRRQRDPVAAERTAAVAMRYRVRSAVRAANSVEGK